MVFDLHSTKFESWLYHLLSVAHVELLVFSEPLDYCCCCEAVVKIRIMSESHLVQNSGNHYYYP